MSNTPVVAVILNHAIKSAVNQFCTRMYDMCERKVRTYPELNATHDGFIDPGFRALESLRQKMSSMTGETDWLIQFVEFMCDESVVYDLLDEVIAEYFSSEYVTQNAEDLYVVAAEHGVTLDVPTLVRAFEINVTHP